MPDLIADALLLNARPTILRAAAERRVAPRCDAFLDTTGTGARVGRCERRVHRDETHVAAVFEASTEGYVERWFEWIEAAS